MTYIGNTARYSVCTRTTPPIELLATTSESTAFAFATTDTDVWDWQAGKVITETMKGAA